MNRKQAAQQGQETLRILEVGQYTAPSGKTVTIDNALRAAIAGTCSYPPDSDLPTTISDQHETRFDVRNETTLSAANRLVADGLAPAVLNFASAKNPGGGFLSGARAQEESLARSSGLYACIEGNPMYAFHRFRKDALYTNYAIYSPSVPVFRSDDGVLLEKPYCCAFITSPAVNAKVVLERDPSRGDEIRQEMQARIQNVLAITAAHHHQSVILGAWGCGVFSNDAEEIAGLFAGAFAQSYKGVFEEVVFAVLDGSKEQRFIGPFERKIGSCSGSYSER